jgi:Homeodomain-like domain
MISLTQGQISVEEVRLTIGATLSREDVGGLLTCICNEPLRYRNRAVAVLSYHRHIRVGHIASFLGVSHSSADNWVRRFAQHGCHLLVPFTANIARLKTRPTETSSPWLQHAFLRYPSRCAERPAHACRSRSTLTEIVGRLQWSGCSSFSVGRQDEPEAKARSPDTGAPVWRIAVWITESPRWLVDHNGGTFCWSRFRHLRSSSELDRSQIDCWSLPLALHT